MRVTVACAPPGREAIVELEVADGATVADAVARSALVAGLGLEPAALGFAIHGQQARPDTPLRDGDRVEILLALRVDPKVARRLRARRPVRGPVAERRTGPGKGG
jgi:putative ubiquitin-RnfH superfamily antitoxin RatB of RatAB toxin-antitoxin module